MPLMSISRRKKETNIVVDDRFAADFEATGHERIGMGVAGETTPSNLSSQSIPVNRQSVDLHTQQDASVHCEGNDDLDDGLHVVLDCANIGWSYGRSEFSVEGLLLAFAYFDALQIRAVGFLPASYVSARPRGGARGNALMETDAHERLQALVSTGRVGRVPPDCHDDLYVLEYAWQRQCYMISNDFYTDHLLDIKDVALREETRRWLAYYRCPYAFVEKHFMLNPKSAFFEELRSRRIHVPMEVSGGGAGSAVQLAVALLEQVQELLLDDHDTDTHKSFGEELGHVLLARARLNLREGSVVSALTDLRRIVKHGWPHADEARHLLDIISQSIQHAH